jgi:hypothetical protein
MNIPKKRNTGPSLDRALEILGSADRLRKLEDVAETARVYTARGERGDYQDLVDALAVLFPEDWDGTPTPQPLSKTASAKRVAKMGYSFTMRGRNA